MQVVSLRTVGLDRSALCSLPSAIWNSRKVIFYGLVATVIPTEQIQKSSSKQVSKDKLEGAHTKSLHIFIILISVPSKISF